MATYRTSCAVCGAEFTAQLNSARYCSGAHRARASREARRDALRTLFVEHTAAVIALQVATGGDDVAAKHTAAAALADTDAQLDALLGK